MFPDIFKLFFYSRFWRVVHGSDLGGLEIF